MKNEPLILKLRLILSALSVVACLTPIQAQPTISKTVGVGAGSHEGNAVVVDSDGSVYLTGQFNTAALVDGRRVATIGGQEVENFGRTDFFLVKYNLDLEPVWAKAAGSNQFDFGIDIAVYGSHHILVVGGYHGAINLDGTDLPYESALSRTDSFISSWDKVSGALAWVATVNGNEDTTVDRCSIGSDGSIYVSGLAQMGNFTIGDRFQSRSILAKLNPEGVFIWAKLAPSNWRSVW